MTSNGNRLGLRQKVVFQPNIPITLMLDHSDGQPTTGRTGEQYMYTFDHSAKIAWLDPEVRDLIVRTGARDGDRIAITKAERRDGAKKHVQWFVERVEDEPAPPPAPAPRPAQPIRPGPDIPQPAAAPPQASNSAARAALADAFAIAVNVAAETEQLATRKGLALRFSAEDLRAIALSVFIGQTRGERRAA